MVSLRELRRVVEISCYAGLYAYQKGRVPMLRPNPNEIFGTKDVIQELKAQLANELRKVRTPVSFDSVESYVKEFSVEIPVLGEPQIKIGVDKAFPAGVEHFSRNCSPDTMIPGKEFILFIPFTGDARVFYHMPSSWAPSGRQEGDIENNRLVIKFGVLTYGVAKPEDITNNINKQRQDIIDRIERWFDLVKKDFINWNDNLNSFIESQIVARKKAIKVEAGINMAINDSLD